MRFGMGEPRIYWHEDKPVPSVSTITKIFRNGIPFDWPAKRAMDFVKMYGLDPDGIDIEDICDDAVGDAARYMDEAAALGTAVHESMEAYFKEKIITPAPLDAPYLDGHIYRTMLSRARKWCEKHNVEPILVEAAMTSPKYGGTIDLFCELDSTAFETKRWCTQRGLDFPRPKRRVKALVDWKVAAGYYEDMPVKLAAYFSLLRNYGYEPEAMLIGRFSKNTGSLNIKDYTDEYSHALHTFVLANEIFTHNFADMLEKLEQERRRQSKASIDKKNVQKKGN